MGPNSVTHAPQTTADVSKCVGIGTEGAWDTSSQLLCRMLTHLLKCLALRVPFLIKASSAVSLNQHKTFSCLAGMFPDISQAAVKPYTTCAARAGTAAGDRL